MIFKNFFNNGLYLLFSALLLISVNAQADVPNWWTLSGPHKETQFKIGGADLHAKITDVSSAVTIIPASPQGADHDIRANVTVFLDSNSGRLLYSLNAQDARAPITDLIPTQSEAEALHIPFAPDLPTNTRIMHATVTVKDDIVIVSYSAEYIPFTHDLTLTNLEYMYGRITFDQSPCRNQCSADNLTIDWSDEYHLFKSSDGVVIPPVYSYDDPIIKPHYPTLTAAITNEHNVVFAGTLEQTIFAKSGHISDSQYDGLPTDDLADYEAEQVSDSWKPRDRWFDSCNPNDGSGNCSTIPYVGARSAHIALLADDTSGSTRGIIVERKRSKGDFHNNLYWHGVRFNFVDGNGINKMDFVEPENSYDFSASDLSKRRVNFDRGIAPMIAFVDGATITSRQGPAIPLLEMHKSDGNNSLFVNIGGVLATDGNDDSYSMKIPEIGTHASMSYHENYSAIRLNAIAGNEYDTFPSLWATPNGDILLARACGRNQEKVCTQWASYNSNYQP